MAHEGREHGWVAPLAAHAGCHASFTLAMTLVINPPLWWFGVVDFALHGITDRARAVVGRRLDLVPGHSGWWWLFGIDQALHQQFASAGKSGALSKDQFEAMQHSRAEATSGRAFARLDSNHDGKLSLQEFSAYQQRTFERMDRNHDGTITADEMASRRRYASRSNGRS